jgi:hypothetical protein
MNRRFALLALILGSILLATLFLTVWVAFSPPIDYVVRAEFQELPPGDEDLKQWLLDQPGVYIGFVQREGRKVTVVWGHSETHIWNSVTPNLREHFEKFGYKGLTAYEEAKSYRDK